MCWWLGLYRVEGRSSYCGVPSTVHIQLAGDHPRGSAVAAEGIGALAVQVLVDGL